MVFFSSIAAAFGNRGQADYAAANDALDKIALSLSHRMDGRVLSVNWGPWAGSGMVTEELEREFTRRGLGLISPETGVQRLLDELNRPDATAFQVLLMQGQPNGADTGSMS